MIGFNTRLEQKLLTEIILIAEDLMEVAATSDIHLHTFLV